MGNHFRILFSYVLLAWRSKRRVKLSERLGLTITWVTASDGDSRYFKVTISAVPAEKSLLLNAIKQFETSSCSAFDSNVCVFKSLAIGLENSDESRVKLVDDATRDKLKKWLNPVDVNTSFQNDLNKRHAGTGEWLFNNCPEFNKWFDGQNRFLWIYGISGSGKTVLRYQTSFTTTHSILLTQASSMIVNKIRDGSTTLNCWMATVHKQCNQGVCYGYDHFNI
ncbi:hypothetical protein B0H14DRAFT_2557488 [Mycena olivaceomarginata]|nr:hypothetical protein B0H14DRAFT_2557488 [Mycena olivaceomarginata]